LIKTKIHNNSLAINLNKIKFLLKLTEPIASSPLEKIKTCSKLLSQSDIRLVASPRCFFFEYSGTTSCLVEYPTEAEIDDVSDGTHRVVGDERLPTRCAANSAVGRDGHPHRLNAA
jgi:hypothetical protein